MISLAAVFVGSLVATAGAVVSYDPSPLADQRPGSTRGSALSDAATKVWRVVGILCLLVGVTVAALGFWSL